MTDSKDKEIERLRGMVDAAASGNAVATEHKRAAEARLAEAHAEIERLRALRQPGKSVFPEVVALRARLADAEAALHVVREWLNAENIPHPRDVREALAAAPAQPAAPAHVTCGDRECTGPHAAPYGTADESPGFNAAKPLSQPAAPPKARASSGGQCPCGDQERPGHPVGWCGQKRKPAAPAVCAHCEFIHEAGQKPCKPAAPAPIQTSPFRRVAEQSAEAWEQPAAPARTEAEQVVLRLVRDVPAELLAAWSAPQAFIGWYHDFGVAVEAYLKSRGIEAQLVGGGYAQPEGPLTEEEAARYARTEAEQDPDLADRIEALADDTGFEPEHEGDTAGEALARVVTQHGLKLVLK